MSSGVISLSGKISGFLSGDKTMAASWELLSPVPNIDRVDLAEGNNQITIPDGTTLILFVPPSANLETLVLKGKGSDNGIQISKSKPFLLTWDSVGKFIINASGLVAGCEITFA